MADPVDDEAYNSASDEDFAPNTIPGNNDATESSSSDDEADVPITTAAAHKRKKIQPLVPNATDDLDFDNSGDEATIERGKRKKRRLGEDVNEDDGGEGGLVKTRAQRRAEVDAKKPLQATTSSSLDVDALFAQMLAQKSMPPPAERRQSNTQSETTRTAETNNAIDSIHAHKPETVIIKRNYVFAGKTITDERTVLADSEEARLYFGHKKEASSIKGPAKFRGRTAPQLENSRSNSASNPAPRPLRRPMKRRSILAADGPDDAILAAAATAAATAVATAAAKAPKLNTLEKSKLDWAAQVDRDGLSEELSEARKAKGTYLGRLDFLGRMDAKREEEATVTKKR